MSRYDSFGSDTLVAREALTEFKKKYDENIIHSAEEVFDLAAATKDEKSPFMVGSKAFHEMTGGISFGKDAEGKYGYIIGDRGIVVPFGASGFDGFQGLIWSCGYTDAIISDKNPPGIVIISNMNDVIDSNIYTDSDGYKYYAFYIYEPCRIKFKAYSSYGTGSASSINTTFTMYNANDMTIIDSKKSLNDTTIKFDGHEILVMNTNIQCSKSMDEEAKYKFFGGWTMEILSLDDDYIYKPTYVQSGHVNGDGKGWDFHKDYGDKTMRFDATMLDRGLRGFIICAGGTVGGGTWMDNYKAAGGVDSYSTGQLVELALDDHIVVTCRYKNNEPTASAYMFLTMPSEQLEGKKMRLVKQVSMWLENYWDSKGGSKSRSTSWTVSGIREGHNGFIMWYGVGGVKVNGSALSSTKSKIVKNGDKIDVTATAGASQSAVAAAIILEV